MFAEGGNAIDAAVASAFALGVCEPAASGLGGQSMLVMHLAETGQTIALDGSSRAPSRATAEQFLGRSRFTGHVATTVPSTLAVLEYTLRQYGTLPLARVLEPAIRIAEEGYPITPLQHTLTQREAKKLRETPGGNIFLKDGTRSPSVGSIFKQPALAETFKRIARKGIEEFYRGKIARMIDADMKAHGGLLRLDDLAQIPWPAERRPLASRFLGKRAVTFPPPGAGPTLVQMFHLVERLPPHLRDLDTPEGALILTEIIRRAYRDRGDRPVDPTYFQQIGDRKRLSGVYAREVADELREKLALPSWTPLHGETTHLSVMDGKGNAVGLTQSIERVYGSHAASPELGFLYNNYMSAFVVEDITHPYYLRPNAVPWASVTPTILFQGRKVSIVLGSPGSERIAPSVLQVLLRLKNHTPFDAVAAPRLFCDLDGVVSLEASRMRSDIPEVLRERGFEVRELEAYAFYLGCVQMVLRQGETLLGVADPRRDGSAGGPR